MTATPSPNQGDWSYHAGKDTQAGTRVDHALIGPALVITDARYLYRAGRHTLAGPANGHGNGHGDLLSDHALLSIRLQRPAAIQRAALPANAAVVAPLSAWASASFAK